MESKVCYISSYRLSAEGINAVNQITFIAYLKNNIICPFLTARFPNKVKVLSFYFREKCGNVFNILICWFKACWTLKKHVFCLQHVTYDLCVFPCLHYLFSLFEIAVVFCSFEYALEPLVCGTFCGMCNSLPCLYRKFKIWR